LGFHFLGTPWGTLSLPFPVWRRQEPFRRSRGAIRRQSEQGERKRGGNGHIQTRSEIRPWDLCGIRPSTEGMVQRYVPNWDSRRQKKKGSAQRKEFSFTICLSRNMGVCALEIADIRGERTAFRAVDVQIAEYISDRSDQRETTSEMFDERYPGRLKKHMPLAFGEKPEEGNKDYLYRQP